MSKARGSSTIVLVVSSSPAPRAEAIRASVVASVLSRSMPRYRSTGPGYMRANPFVTSDSIVAPSWRPPSRLSAVTPLAMS